MNEIVFQKHGLDCTLSTSDLEMLLILAASEIKNNPPTDCSFDWEEAISKALLKLKE